MSDNNHPEKSKRSISIARFRQRCRQIFHSTRTISFKRLVLIFLYLDNSTTYTLKLLFGIIRNSFPFHQPKKTVECQNDR